MKITKRIKNEWSWMGKADDHVDCMYYIFEWYFNRGIKYQKF